MLRGIPLVVVLTAIASIGTCGCGGRTPTLRSVTLATTTSTRDSGLLGELLPLFERRTGIRVRVVAVGSGQALALARRGDADVLLTHAPKAEAAFVAAGYGIDRREVMFNEFVLVGPADDPAQVQGAKGAADAFRRVARASACFVSRGDDSGTHRREKALWNAAGLVPGGRWYLESGAGMAQTLRIAAEKRVYCLTDRATWLALAQQLDLRLLLENDPALRNVYSVILVNPERFSHVHANEARQLWRFFQSAEARQLIDGFGIERYGQQLFHAIDRKSEPASLPAK